MDALTEFEYTPVRQPIKGKSITVTLRPLGPDGQWDIERTIEDGKPSWRAIVKSSKHIVGWSGDGVEEFSRETLNKHLDKPTIQWRLFFFDVTGHLWAKSLISEGDQKKS